MLIKLSKLKHFSPSSLSSLAQVAVHGLGLALCHISPYDGGVGMVMGILGIHLRDIDL